ncbi:alpha/beta hydrolase [Alicyclobacillus tolerans]|uniref:alpha/beta fold hydrolase n=1 Tax=Alicyclobacillus tolerans TaxID=90970 RepID=UPI001F1610FC|nr:alpha/beta hydrolase [Alicyclobacillus tolerans]MCF8565132.1 alpha/beta hydrolase [Alicyclobacillus tolerans]
MAEFEKGQDVLGRYINVNGLSLYVRDAGAGDGEKDPVLLLHGFPDTGDLWRFQVPFLVERGYRTIVPDLRGRGLSDKPADVQDYRMSKLVSDVSGLLDALHVQRVHLVGHDFGAALAWVCAAALPDRIRTLTVLSVGAPSTGELPSLEALQKAWYRILFVFPGNVAERLVAEHDWYLFRQLTGSSPDADKYLENMKDPDALTAGLNWYRAITPVDKLVSVSSREFEVKAPTLGVFSSGDVALSEEAMKSSQKVVKAPWRYEKMEGIGHWIPLENPNGFNQLLAEFLNP